MVVERRAAERAVAVTAHRVERGGLHLGPEDGASVVPAIVALKEPQQALELVEAVSVR